MLKRTFTILLFVVGITIIGLGAFNMAKADDCGNFNITLDEPVRVVGDIFKYDYYVTGGDLGIKNISLFHLGIDANVVVNCPGGMDCSYVTVQAPGVGTISDGWLEGVPQLQTLTVTAQNITEGEPLTIYVSGTGGNVGAVATHTKAGRKVETCFVDGPVVGLPIDASVPSSKIVNLNGVDFCIDLDPLTGCPDPNPVVYNCETKVPLPIDANFVLGSNAASGDPQGPTTPTIVHGEGSDPRCPVSKVAHNPCQWVCVGGTCYGAYCW